MIMWDYIYTKMSLYPTIGIYAEIDVAGTLRYKPISIKNCQARSHSDQSLIKVLPPYRSLRMYVYILTKVRGMWEQDISS